MRIGYVSLNVSDLQRSLEFYESVLGFEVKSRSGERALLFAERSSSHLVELQQAATTKGEGAARENKEKRAGLYHFAILLPERKYLADMLLHLGENRGSVHFDGMADHLVSESLYIRDPDHIGIEIYSDRPSQQWQWADGGSRVQMSTERLDTEGLLKEAAAAGKGGWWKAMPAGTTIGHVHLHVSNLGKATRFYSGALGLDLTCEFPGARFFAADKYHHHIATNTWLGTGVLPALPGGLGLDHFGIELPSAQAFADTTDHMMRSGYAVVVEEEGMPPQGKGALLHDADNIAIRLYYCHRHGQRQ